MINLLENLGKNIFRKVWNLSSRSIFSQIRQKISKNESQVGSFFETQRRTHVGWQWQYPPRLYARKYGGFFVPVKSVMFWQTVLRRRDKNTKKSF